ncbi:Fic family protein [Mucilaginibacter jinjuensis]|uniref:Fic family protein n=1 Tax=Mucilaginibacter jinjuensis TaxID=1176721 RepID=A0ABY7TBL9_9SPHI|nr:Fic family protein [Mucilaginibacter jinjuensis]WCT13103.1 Fic family protein [Mucilaginibacter jinjuensis]
MTSTFRHSDLNIIKPTFDSPVTDLVIDLEKLRERRLSGTTHPQIFFQLKHIFHLLESIGSARIEGNNTTIAEYIEIKIEGNNDVSEQIREIQNIEKAMIFIDENIKDNSINRAFISEVHKLIVEDLTPPPNGEGDKTPGDYRKHDLSITKSTHKPPSWMLVENYMNELINFINTDQSPKYDLLKVAIAHHRFVWIHPFGNGNGRTVRLFTYAMLVKLGFNVNIGNRILNPTAIFCSDREEYYEHLSAADTNEEAGILQWCEYVLNGLKIEIEKIDKLLDYNYLKQEILFPMIDFSAERRIITEIEGKILKVAITEQIIQASDIKHIFPDKSQSEISRQIKKLIDKKMLIPAGAENARKYVIRFDNNYLLRGIIKVLGEKGFLPIAETKTS